MEHVIVLCPKRHLFEQLFVAHAFETFLAETSFSKMT